MEIIDIDIRRRDLQTISKATVLAIAISLCSGCGGGSSGSSGESAQAASILKALTGDGSARVLAFGDSITEGVGDEVPGSARGYPSRLEPVLAVPIDQQGVSGEALAFAGLNRLTGLLPQSDAGIVILDEGNSDAYEGVTVANYRSALESAVGAIEDSGKVTILMNQYPTCCAAGGHQTELDAVNGEMNQVAAEHGIRLADLDRAWKSTCDRLPDCDLLSGDGLHPNSRGYDVIAQVVLATLAGIDVFSPHGATDLEKAYALPKGSVIVKPDE